MKVSGIKLEINPGRAQLSKSGYTLEEEEKIYEEMLEDVYENPRWYLDNYTYLVEVRVSWINYRECNITKPYKYVENRLKKRNIYK